MASAWSQSVLIRTLVGLVVRRLSRFGWGVEFRGWVGSTRIRLESVALYHYATTNERGSQDSATTANDRVDRACERQHGEELCGSHAGIDWRHGGNLPSRS